MTTSSIINITTMSDPANIPWTRGEKRICSCDVYDGEPHEVSRTVWYRHRNRQRQINQRGSQEVQPQVLDCQNDADVLDAASRDSTPQFNDPLSDHDDAPIRMPSPTFVDDNVTSDSPQPQRVRRTIRKNTASRPSTRRQPRPPRPQVRQAHSHLPQAPDIDHHIDYHAEAAVDSPSESHSQFDAELYAESSPEPLMEYDAGIASDNGPIPLVSGADNCPSSSSSSSSSNSSCSSGSDADNELIDEPIDEPYFVDNIGEEEEQLEDIHNTEDFPYQVIPNINVPDTILKHYALMKVQMDGNVAQNIHRRYLAAVEGFISISDEASARRELGVITEINHVRYDVCRNNCICFAAFPTAKTCHMCKADRKDANGKPYRTFDYIPFIHRLCLLYTDAGYVRETMKYKESFPTDMYTADNPRVSTRDYWDSLLYSAVKQRGLWSDIREVGFIFSTDGFSLFKIGQYDVWPLLLINCNLPPSERVLRKNLMLCGIIPGPGNPKDISSFLKPMIDEFCKLQNGVKAWDGLRKESFILRAHIALISGDTMAMAKLMKWTGPNSYRYCRFCAIYGISERHIYCPLEPPRDRDPTVGPTSDVGGEKRDSEFVSNKRKGRAERQPARKSTHFPEKSWDPNNLPLWTDKDMRHNQTTMEDTMDPAWGKLMGTNGVPIFSCLRSIVYPWVFAPDTMHLLDENTPRLYLAHWMGVYRDREIASLSRMQSKTLAGDNRADIGQSQAQSETQAESQIQEQLQTQDGSQAESQFETQVESQAASEGRPGPHSQVVSGRGESSLTGARINSQSKRRRGRRGISFNTNVDHYREVERDSYVLSKKIWDKIGAEIADSRCTIPSAFGKAFRDIKYHASYKATELMNFMHLISPVVLNQRLPAQYYDHWHHFVLSTEKSRRYQISMSDISEMEKDMIRVVTDYERLYYQYKLSKISSCTTQVHGLLHLSMAMRVCGPNPIYHQYTMERTVGTIKAMCHSRSSANRNLSLRMLEHERFKYLPLIAIVPFGFNDSETKEKGLFGLSERDKASYPDYPDCLLMGPKVSRLLNRYERANLREFHASVTGRSARGLPDKLFSCVFKLWGKAVAGKVLSNENEYEVLGSKISNPGTGSRVATSRRNNSWVRYIMADNYDNDTSYFGKVMFFMQYEIESEDEEEGPDQYILAYVERVNVGRVRKVKLAYRVEPRGHGVQKLFVELTDIQELVGVIKSRGKDFLVSRTSCFWPKKNFYWGEHVDNKDLFDDASGLE